MGMDTITIEVLFPGAASIFRILPQLTQVGVGIRVDVIASQCALVDDVATGAVDCGWYGSIIAGPVRRFCSLEMRRSELQKFKIRSAS